MFSHQMMNKGITMWMMRHKMMTSSDREVSFVYFYDFNADLSQFSFIMEKNRVCPLNGLIVSLRHPFEFECIRDAGRIPSNTCHLIFITVINDKVRWWFCVNASFHLYRVILYRAVISVIYSFMEAQGIQIKNEERNAVCKPHGLLGSSQSATNRLKLAFWDQRPSSVWSSWFLLLCPLFSLFHIPAKKINKKDTVKGIIYSERYMFGFLLETYLTYLSVLVCACDVVIWRDGQKSPTAVCLCVCVTGACHLITGHTNLII